MLAVLLGVVSIGPRMLLFGWLCMVGLLIVLDHFRETGKGLWMLPPLFALWINFHGSWIFGMVVLVVTIAAGLVRGEWGLIVARRWSPAEFKKLLLASGRFAGRPLRKPFRIQVGAIPVRPSFSPEGCYAAPRRVAIGARSRRHGQAGADHDLRIAGDRAILPPSLEAGRD